nr:DUF6064 family protein [uncultured Cohaesibacter sp.]
MPFTEEELFAIFAAWNTAAWPSQILAYGFGLLAVGLLFRPSQKATRVILSILALMWSVNGTGFHWLFYTKVTPAAWVFGLAFVLQGLFLAATLFIMPDFRISPERDLPTKIGFALLLYAMVLYPLVGISFGQAYPALPTFGIIPCPTTIFTIGILLMGNWTTARWLLVIPCLWGVIGGSAAVFFGVPQDYGLIVAMLLAVGIFVGNALNFNILKHKIHRPV